MRLLLIGATSFVGAALRAHPAWPATGRATFHTEAIEGGVPLDVRDPGAVARVLDALDPTHIIDCSLAGRDDPDTAARAAAAVCEAIHARGRGRLVFVSSDAVFRGDSTRPYTEEDRVAPTSAYGAAKAAAEQVVLARLSDSCVARTCLVYGRDVRPGRSPLGARVASVVDVLASGKTLPQYTAQYRTPTDVFDLAGALLRVAATDFTGVLHLAGAERLSRADFARTVAQIFGFDPRGVVEQPLAETAAFGVDTSLSSSLAARVLDWQPRSVTAALTDLRTQKE